MKKKSPYQLHKMKATGTKFNMNNTPWPFFDRLRLQKYPAESKGGLISHTLNVEPPIFFWDKIIFR